MEESDKRHWFYTTVGDMLAMADDKDVHPAIVLSVLANHFTQYFYQKTNGDHTEQTSHFHRHMLVSVMFFLHELCKHPWQEVLEILKILQRDFKPHELIEHCKELKEDVNKKLKKREKHHDR